MRKKKERKERKERKRKKKKENLHRNFFRIKESVIQAPRGKLLEITTKPFLPLPLPPLFFFFFFFFFFYKQVNRRDFLSEFYFFLQDSLQAVIWKFFQLIKVLVGEKEERKKRKRKRQTLK